MFDRRWTLPPDEGARAEALAEASGVNPVTAGVLLRRGLDTPAAVRRFLAPRLDDLSEPASILGMCEAASRVAKAVRARQRIWICGDYDVDGTGGTAILLRFFRALGVPARFHIPNRLRDGYGLQVPAVDFMAAEGCDLAITVDNGISALEAAAHARARGIDLIITDHHEPPEVLPEAFALVDPHLPGCASAYKELCGAALAFKLAWAVAKELGAGRASGEVRDILVDLLGIVALATVADVAPLDGENRVLVRYGLQALSRTRMPGILALKRVAGLDGALTARDLGFALGPRINAGGRLADASLAVRLLTTEDPAEAGTLASELESLNLQRREVEKRVVEEALARVPDPLSPVVALSDPDWHPGVLGIAAAKLAERTGRPTLLAALDGATGMLKGSARSIPGFDITAALARGRGHLAAYGGHAYAAGFTVRKDGFEALVAALSSEVVRWSGGEIPRPEVAIDAEVNLNRLTEGLVAELGHLAPHGEGNPEPVLMARRLRVAGEPRRLGREGAHLSFLAREEGSPPALRVIAFKEGPSMGRIPSRFDLAFTPRLNAWKGRVSVELEAVALRTACPTSSSVSSGTPSSCGTSPDPPG